MEKSEQKKTKHSDIFQKIAVLKPPYEWKILPFQNLFMNKEKCAKKLPINGEK
jgi:hypothetical protein